MENHIGRNINAHRLKLNLKQDQIADFLGIKRENISYYENGTREIPIQYLEKLADLFGVELYDLMESNLAHQEANIAFAFRADQLDSVNLENISRFKKIVKNYIKMKEQIVSNEK